MKLEDILKAKELLENSPIRGRIELVGNQNQIDFWKTIYGTSVDYILEKRLK